MPARITLTASELCSALWGADSSELNIGCYDGTDTPLRPVPANAIVHITDTGLIKVTDNDGGWIADRICGTSVVAGCPVLGRRQWARLLVALD